MKQELLDRWIAALESGEHKKGKGVLCNSRDEKCCLGVLAEIEGKLTKKPNNCRVRHYHGKPNFYKLLPPHSFGLSTDTQQVLASINDRSETFVPVIKYIKVLVQVTE